MDYKYVYKNIYAYLYYISTDNERRNRLNDLVLFVLLWFK